MKKFKREENESESSAEFPRTFEYLFKSVLRMNKHEICIRITLYFKKWFTFSDTVKFNVSL